MNFQALKWMIDSLVKTFKCPECFAEVHDDSVDIIGAAWNTINIDIECPKCNRHSMIKSEVLMVDLRKVDLVKNKLEQIKTKLESLNLESGTSKLKTTSIKDKEIIELNKTLKKKNLGVSDLFS